MLPDQGLLKTNPAECIFKQNYMQRTSKPFDGESFQKESRQRKMLLD